MEREDILNLIKMVLSTSVLVVEETDVERYSGFYREDDGDGTLRSAASRVRRLDPEDLLRSFSHAHGIEV